MRCPACGNLEDRVVDSRAAEDGSSIRRRRQCERCNARFTTFERLDEVSTLVVKRDGRTAPFDRERIRNGVSAACKGSPVDEVTVDAIVARVVDRLSSFSSPVESAQIGALVLEELRRIDRVAAVRFASVYKAFSDPQDFEREVQLMSDEPEQVDAPAPAGNGSGSDPGVVSGGQEPER
ncbi:MAG: transcriptional regulator NrdR [Microthrixaceae bacterium]|jgi:transcriptional repressor NrdR